MARIENRSKGPLNTILVLICFIQVTVSSTYLNSVSETVGSTGAQFLPDMHANLEQNMRIIAIDFSDSCLFGLRFYTMKIVPLILEYHIDLNRQL